MQNKILIVEDEKTLVKVLVHSLQKNNFEVIVGKNGEEGLKLAKKEHPDLILLDILMPVMDGITMLSELRKDEWGSSARVMMLTNLTTEEKKVESKINNVIAYVVKSDISMADLILKIQKVMVTI